MFTRYHSESRYVMELGMYSLMKSLIGTIILYVHYSHYLVN